MSPSHTLDLNILVHGTECSLLAERNNLMEERDKAKKKKKTTILDLAHTNPQVEE